MWVVSLRPVYLYYCYFHIYITFVHVSGMRTHGGPTDTAFTALFIGHVPLPCPEGLSPAPRRCHSGLRIGFSGRRPARQPAAWGWRVAARCCLGGRPGNGRMSEGKKEHRLSGCQSEKNQGQAGKFCKKETLNVAELAPRGSGLQCSHGCTDDC